jgi:hypothetical protein
MSRPLAAITGASSGIGAVFARKLAERGYDLLLIARRRDRLAEVAAALPHPCVAETCVADLTVPEDLEAVATRLETEPRLSLLVNNAGFGTKGLFFEAPLEDQVRMHRLHVDATLRLTRAALPGMVGRDSGAVVNVSSVAGFTHNAGSVSYSATKAWINSFTEGLYLDLRAAGSRVIVQALCPGFTYTEFHDTMGLERSTIPRSLWMRAEDVVDASLAGLGKRKLFVVPGWKYRLIVAILPKLPFRMRLALEQRAPYRKDRV